MRFDLVFEGGGAKGTVFVGALQAFAEAGHTFDRLIGTSAGAIMAALLAAGYKPDELLKALNERVDGKSIFTTFMVTPPPFDKADARQSAIRQLLGNMDLPLVPDAAEKRMDDWLAEKMATDQRFRSLYSFVERGGWYSAHNFVTWLQRKLDEGSYRGKPRRFSKMTLAGMYRATKTELTLTATDTNNGHLIILNHRTAPKLPVVWAVRMSMSIPLLWQEVIWHEKWGTYRDQSLVGHTIVDGGVLSNFPIELFVSDASMVTAVMGPKRSQNVLGFLIDEQIEVPNAAPTIMKPDDASALDNLRTVERFRKLINTITQAGDKMVIDAYSRLVLRLPAKGYGTTEFDMTDERRTALVKAGYATTKNYLDDLAESQAGLEGMPSQSKDIDLEQLEQSAATADRIALNILGQ